MKKEILNPPALGAPPRFYSHAVSIEGPAKLVCVAGQLSVDQEGGFMVGLDAANVAAYREGRAGYFKIRRPPASTLAGVARLVQPEWLLEVEVVAAVAPKKKKR
jgi:enamine deaminase RidA (YjgF/YER057c/UK114 family)